MVGGAEYCTASSDKHDKMCRPLLFILGPLGYEMVYLPLTKVADTPFHIQGDNLSEMTQGICSVLTLKSLD